MEAAWTSLIAPENATRVGAWGLTISLVGFAITIWQIVRTRRAADAAVAAANLARLQLSAFSGMRECEIARRQISSVREHIAKGDWDAVIDSYQPLGSSLSALAESNVAFDDDVKTNLGSARDIVERNCATIEKNRSITPASLSKQKQFSALRPIEAAVTKAIFNIERLA